MPRSFGDGNIDDKTSYSIYLMKKVKTKVSVICKHFGIGRSTVYEVVNRVSAWENGHKKKKTGPRPKLNIFALKRLETVIISNRFDPIYGICNKFNEGGEMKISTRRLRRYVHKSCFLNHAAVHKPFIRSPNILKRIV